MRSDSFFVFDFDIYMKSLLIAALIGAALSIGSFITTGTITMVDIIGGTINAPILAYWLHLMWKFKSNESEA